MTFIKKNINTIINIALVIALGFSFLYTQSVEAKFTKATENYGKKLNEALEANNKVNKSLDELIASLKAKYVDNNGGQ